MVARGRLHSYIYPEKLDKEWKIVKKLSFMPTKRFNKFFKYGLNDKSRVGLIPRILSFNKLGIYLCYETNLQGWLGEELFSLPYSYYLLVLHYLSISM